MSKKILVIDDDFYIRELFEEILEENKDYEVGTAVNGSEGIEKLKKGGYDLVLLDMLLPDFNGLAILDKLNQDPPAQKNGPIILLSNIDDVPMIEEAMKKGAVAHLIKSEITPDKLISAVQKYIF